MKGSKLRTIIIQYALSYMIGKIAIKWLGNISQRKYIETSSKGDVNVLNYIDTILMVISDVRNGIFSDGQVVVNVDERVDRWFLRELVEYIPESCQLIGDVTDYSAFNEYIPFIILEGTEGSLPSVILVFTSELEQCIWMGEYGEDDHL